MRPHPERQMQELGVFVHGVLAGLHALGLVFNLRRRSWFDVAMHGAALVYDTSAAVRHLEHVRAIHE